MKSYETVTEAVRELQQRGYTHDFMIRTDCLFCDSKSIRLRPEEFMVDEVYRFEGDTDPGDENVVYAISSVDQKLRGVLVLAFGTYAEEVAPEMLARLQYRPNQ